MTPTLPSAPALTLVLDQSGEYFIAGTDPPVVYHGSPITPEILVSLFPSPDPEYSNEALPAGIPVQFGGATYTSTSDARFFRVIELDENGNAVPGGVQILSDVEVKAKYQLPPVPAPAALSTSTPDQVRAYVGSFVGASAQLAAALSIACLLAEKANQAPAAVAAPGPAATS